jgi:hypothetical protein
MEAIGSGHLAEAIQFRRMRVDREIFH